MPAAARSTAAVNLLMENPILALEVTAGLILATPAAIKLRDILRHAGVNDADLTEAERMEVAMLDEAAPVGFFGNAVATVHRSLLGWRMREGGAAPQLSWRHGMWNVRHRGITLSSDPWVDDAARAHDWVDVSTPMLNEQTKQLV
jgi:hypothetical protein